MYAHTHHSDSGFVLPGRLSTPALDGGGALAPTEFIGAVNCIFRTCIFKNPLNSLKISKILQNLAKPN